ncbi:MAG: manganese-dependent inorganic pyrophosphatase [Nanoarchaeota archaeon]|nr:manganese-dependent inorganic pyrophosphatase [Nanoarchaeota archaeon]
MKIVIGHKSPDTDATCSAIVYAELNNAEARIMGPLNKETEYALKKFGAEPPKIWKGEGDEFILVDHNESEQSIGDYSKVIEIIDHHKIKIETEKTIKVHVEPLGSTCTIIAQKHFEKLTKKQAGLILSAILSDTIVFKSPTTTKTDIEIAKRLGEKIETNEKEYGLELKKAGMSLEGMSVEQIIKKDYKEYTLQGKKFFIGQVENADLKETLNIKKQLLTEMKKMNYDYVLLMLTDIIHEITELLIIGNETKIGKVFGKIVKENSITLPKVLSRKKQVVPQITKQFS